MSNFLPGFGTSWTKAKPHTQFTPFSDKNERRRPLFTAVSSREENSSFSHEE